MFDISPKRWYALYTKARHEFIVYEELRRKGVEALLPSFQKLQQWKDRKKFVEFPLFPGYLCVHIQQFILSSTVRPASDDSLLGAAAAPAEWASNSVSGS